MKKGIFANRVPIALASYLFLLGCGVTLPGLEAPEDRGALYLSREFVDGSQPDVAPRITYFRYEIFTNRPGAAQPVEGVRVRPVLETWFFQPFTDFAEVPDGTYFRAESDGSFTGGVVVVKPTADARLENRERELRVSRIVGDERPNFRSLNLVENCDLDLIMSISLNSLLERTPGYDPDVPTVQRWRVLEPEMTEDSLMKKEITAVGWTTDNRVAIRYDGRVHVDVDQQGGSLVSNAPLRVPIYLTFSYVDFDAPVECSALQPAILPDRRAFTSDVEIEFEQGRSGQIFIRDQLVYAWPTSSERPDLATPLFLRVGRLVEPDVGRPYFAGFRSEAGIEGYFD